MLFKMWQHQLWELNLEGWEESHWAYEDQLNDLPKEVEHKLDC